MNENMRTNLNAFSAFSSSYKLNLCCLAGGLNGAPQELLISITRSHPISSTIMRSNYLI